MTPVKAIGGVEWGFIIIYYVCFSEVNRMILSAEDGTIERTAFSDQKSALFAHAAKIVFNISLQVENGNRRSLEQNVSPKFLLTKTCVSVRLYMYISYNQLI